LPVVERAHPAVVIHVGGVARDLLGVEELAVDAAGHPLHRERAVAHVGQAHRAMFA
jgi:hypothetical protein